MSSLRTVTGALSRGGMPPQRDFMPPEAYRMERNPKNVQQAARLLMRERLVTRTEPRSNRVQRTHTTTGPQSDKRNVKWK